jgi:hypothetical protein
MPLNLATIRESSDDDELFKLISAELARRFSRELQQDPAKFLAALAKAPRGLRAMAAVYDLDASLTAEDLAGHFVHHTDVRFLNETVAGLHELGAGAMAEIFTAAWDVVKPHLAEMGQMDWQRKSPSTYFAEVGIQESLDSLNEKARRICRSVGRLGLAEYWIVYARKYPERCLDPS